MLSSLICEYPLFFVIPPQNPATSIISPPTTICILNSMIVVHVPELTPLAPSLLDFKGLLLILNFEHQKKMAFSLTFKYIYNLNQTGVRTQDISNQTPNLLNNP